MSSTQSIPLFSTYRSAIQKPSAAIAIITVLLLCHENVSRAQTWNLGAGGSWNAPASWNPATIPNAVGASVTFNSATSGSNPAQTGNSSVALDVSQTVGSIAFNNDAVNSFTYSLATGTSGPLVFDAAGAGPATIAVNSVSGSTGNDTISVAMTLNDTVVATVNNVTASSAAGALNLTGTMGGNGGFTKLGDGLATLGTGAKTYTGPTVLSGGRTRVSLVARPQNTSSLTINAGGQVDLISAGTYTFGSGPLNLNGAGPATGPFAPFPGAIRPDTGLVITINNAVVLQSDSLIHVQGLATGSTTLAGNVSGPGKLTFTSTPHDANLGVLVVNGANTYGGGTVVDGGTLDVSGASATLGTGGVTVHSASLVFAGASAKLKIESGVLDAIADTATLSLAGGATVGVADDGYADLSTGVNEMVGSLVLGGVAQTAGTYGSTASSAMFTSDEYFAGSGMITVVRPILKIVSSPPNVIVSWTTNAVGFGLQAIGAVGDTWTNDPTTIVPSGTDNTVTETPVGTKFYRLVK